MVRASLPESFKPASERAFLWLCLVGVGADLLALQPCLAGMRLSSGDLRRAGLDPPTHPPSVLSAPQMPARYIIRRSDWASTRPIHVASSRMAAVGRCRLGRQVSSTPTALHAVMFRDESRGTMTSEEFDQPLWDTVNTLRGALSAAEYKYAALGLMFLKYVSDMVGAKEQADPQSHCRSGLEYHIQDASFRADSWRKSSEETTALSTM